MPKGNKMKTDRELLELAAGIVESLEWFEKENCFVLDNVVWNPIADDGDALRLAAMLKIDLRNFTGASVLISASNASLDDDCDESYGEDPYAATRRAIVRAASAIGETE